LDFQKAIGEEVKPYAWMVSLRLFGQWWAARDDVATDFMSSEEGSYVMKLKALAPIEGLVLEMNSQIQITDSSSPAGSFKIDGNILDNLSGQQTISFRTWLQ